MAHPEYVKTKAEFDAKIGGSKPVAVDFTAVWCGPCKKIAPIFEALSIENPGIEFIKVDVDENEETAMALEIQSMPTFHFYKDGTLVNQFSGASEDKLRKGVDSLK